LAGPGVTGTIRHDQARIRRTDRLLPRRPYDRHPLYNLHRAIAAAGAGPSATTSTLNAASLGTDVPLIFPLIRNVTVCLPPGGT